ncbi:MAG: hypothetical protein HY935_00295 [Nitrosomonadales bacterium]|nr:hypothetical protein [Nitrosomonadales bacterium]
MSSILSQVSYPVFLYCMFVFFIVVSIFSFIVGVSFTLRNATMLRLFVFMNKGFSTRKAIKRLAMPRFIEPALLKHPNQLGAGIILGAATSIFLLRSVDAVVFQPVFLGPFSYSTAVALSIYTKSFLLIGNGICVAVGLLILFFPSLLSSIEAYTDKWHTLRKRTRPLDQMHDEVDKWVLAHPTVFGATLSILSLGLFATMYARI